MARFFCFGNQLSLTRQGPSSLKQPDDDHMLQLVSGVSLEVCFCRYCLSIPPASKLPIKNTHVYLHMHRNRYIIYMYILYVYIYVYIFNYIYVFEKNIYVFI